MAAILVGQMAPRDKAQRIMAQRNPELTKALEQLSMAGRFDTMGARNATTELLYWLMRELRTADVAGLQGLANRLDEFLQANSRLTDFVQGQLQAFIAIAESVAGLVSDPAFDTDFGIEAADVAKACTLLTEDNWQDFDTGEFDDIVANAIAAALMRLDHPALRELSAAIQVAENAERKRANAWSCDFGFLLGWRMVLVRTRYYKATLLDPLAYNLMRQIGQQASSRPIPDLYGLVSSLALTGYAREMFCMPVREMETLLDRQAKRDLLRRHVTGDGRVYYALTRYGVLALQSRRVAMDLPIDPPETPRALLMAA